MSFRDFFESFLTFFYFFLPSDPTSLVSRQELKANCSTQKHSNASESGHQFWSLRGFRREAGKFKIFRLIEMKHHLSHLK